VKRGAQLSFLAAQQPHTLFFAILLGNSVGARAGELTRHLSAQHRFKGRSRPAELLHISLCSVGEYEGVIPQGIVDDARECAATVTFPPFDVAFNRVVSFGGKAGAYPLVLLGSAGITKLIELRRELFVAVKKKGIGRKEKENFEPHVTLLYDELRIDPHPVEPLAWTVHEFALVDSLVGRSEYKSLGTWPLRG
jgi:2'-5' RNA ligase